VGVETGQGLFLGIFGLLQCLFRVEEVVLPARDGPARMFCLVGQRFLLLGQFANQA